MSKNFSTMKYNRVFALLNLLGMVEGVPIKPEQQIEYGRASTLANADNIYAYDVLGFNSAEAIVNESSVHPWVTLLAAFRSVFASVRDEDFTITGTTINDAICMLNLGRLARIRHEGDSYLYTLSVLQTELTRNIVGVPCTAGTIEDKYKTVAKWILGGAMDGFVGSWNSTHYRPADDILAGCIIVLCYVMFWWTGFVLQSVKLLKKIGTFSAIDGILRGSYVPLINSNSATWGSLLLAQENLAVNQFPSDSNDHETTWLTTGLNFFGMNILSIDDATLRGVNVAIYTHAVTFWNKLLNRSEWVWRFGKSVSHEPVFLAQTFSATQHGLDGQQAAIDMWDSQCLFSADAGDLHNNWRWFNWYVLDTITMFKDFYFRNASFAKIKALFTVTPYTAVTPPPAIGLGGLLVYQMIHWEDGGIDVDGDALMFKGIVDEDNAGHKVLCSRRSTSENYRFMTIGDITVQDYRILNALTAMTFYSLDGGASAPVAIPDDYAPLVVQSGFAFTITKTEDLPYQIDRHINWLTAAYTRDTQYEYVDNDSEDVTHPARSHAHYKTWVNSTDLTNEFPVTLIGNKPVFYYGRSADPFKKLKHVVHDVNNLDAALVRADMLALYWPSSGGSIASSPLTVSAMGNPGEIVRDSPTQSIAAVPDSALQPVSSVASAAKAVTEAKKDVTVAEKKLSEEKKKD